MHSRLKNSIFCLFAFCGLAVGIFQPFSPALTATGHWVIMAVVITMGLWVLEPFGIPIGISGCFFLGFLLLIGLPAKTVFSGFTQSAVWTLIPALFFGYALKKTGLGTRIAYIVLKSVRITYPSLLILWAVIGVILSLLTPSITVRIVIITPLVLDCADLCALKQGTRGRSLVLLSAWAMAVIPGIGWKTGSLMGPILTGIFASVPGIPEVSFNDWLRVAFLPAILVSALLLIGGYFALRPEQKLNIPKETFREKYKTLPAVTPAEKITGLVLALCFILFTTSSLHHIPDAAICLFGLVLLYTTGVFDASDIETGISWNLILFTGSAMSFGAIFTQSGVSDWLSSNLLPLFAPIVGNPWLLVYAVLIFLFLWRFVDVALLTPTIVVFAPVIPALSETYGIDPLVWIPLFSLAICAFFLRYQSMFCLTFEAGAQARGWTKQHLFRYAVVYFLACLVAMLAVVPYWESIGLFGAFPY